MSNALLESVKIKDVTSRPKMYVAFALITAGCLGAALLSSNTTLTIVLYAISALMIILIALFALLDKPHSGQSANSPQGQTGPVHGHRQTGTGNVGIQLGGGVGRDLHIHGAPNGDKTGPVGSENGSTIARSDLYSAMEGMHQVFHACRDMHVKLDNDELPGLPQEFQLICEHLASALRVFTGKQLAVTIALHSKSGIRVLARDTTTKRENRDNNDGQTEYPTDETNTALFSLCANFDKNRRWYFNPDCPNSGYVCSLKNWQNYFKTTLCVPIQTWKEQVDENPARVIVGFLIVDGREKNAFEEPLGSALACFADTFYPVLVRYAEVKEAVALKQKQKYDETKAAKKVGRPRSQKNIGTVNPGGGESV